MTRPPPLPIRPPPTAQEDFKAEITNTGEVTGRGDALPQDFLPQDSKKHQEQTQEEVMALMAECTELRTKNERQERLLKDRASPDRDLHHRKGT